MTSELMVITLDTLKVRVVKQAGEIFPYIVDSRTGTARWVKVDAFVERADAFSAAIFIANQH